jgi:hypothetical protein
VLVGHRLITLSILLSLFCWKSNLPLLLVWVGSLLRGF